MKTACLTAMISLMTMVCFGCGGGGSSGGTAGSSGGGGGSSSAAGGSSSAAGGSSSAGGGSSSAAGGSSSAGGGSSGGAGSSGGGGSSGGASASASTTDSSASSKPLSIEGDWLFLGPTGPGHKITISSKSITYKATETDWESNWTIKKYDNDLHQFQIVFDSGHGEGAYPSGENFSATFELQEMFLNIQLAKGLDSYPKLDVENRCTDGLEPIPDCKLYMKMQ